MSDQVWSREWLCLPCCSLQMRLTQACWTMKSCSEPRTERASSASPTICFWCRRSCRSSWSLCRCRPSLYPRASLGKVTVVNDGSQLPETCLIFTNVLLKHQLHILFWLLKHFSLPLPRVSEVECWADYNKRVIPIIIGAVVVCLLIIAVLTFLFIRDRRREGYDTLWAGAWSEPAQRICCTHIWIQHVLLHLHFW